MTTLAEIQEMRERRAKLVHDAREKAAALKDNATDAERAEVESQVDQMMDEVDTLKDRIDRAQRLYDADRDLAGVPGLPGERPGVVVPRGESDAEFARRLDGYNAAFETFIRFGERRMTAEQLEALAAGVPSAEFRAQSVGSDGAGGYTVPTTLQGEIMRAQEAYEGVRSVARVITTGDGRTLQWPTVNDTSNKAAIIGEGVASSDTDITFAQKEIGAYMYRTMVTVSRELLQDTIVDMNGLISATFGERLFLGLNEDLTIGTGSSEPNGVVTASALGRTASQENAISYIDLLELMHSVKQAYRRNAHFMMADGTLKAIKSLLDADGRPLWAAGIAVREPDSILGKPYVVNDDMPALEGAAKSVLFGDFSSYLLRDVSGMAIERLVERYAEKGQIAFILFSRHDGELMSADATTHNTVKHLLHPS